MTALPGILGEWAEIIGEAAAREVALHLGGQEIRIAERPGDANRLARVIGADAARRIAREWGTGDVRVPMGLRRRDLRIRALLAQGVPHNVIAKTVGCSIRNVEHHAQRAREDRQLDLPPQRRD